MRIWILFFILAASLCWLPGCYTPEGGSSIPWNEPQQGEGSFTPRVNF